MQKLKHFLHFFVYSSISQKRSLSWIMLSMLFSIGLWTGLNIYSEYHSTLNQSYYLLEVRAKQHEARIISLLHHINMTIESIGEELNEDDEPKDYHRLLKKYTHQLKESHGILITDAHGKIFASTLPEIIGFDAHEREYFKTHRLQPNDMLHLSKPFKTLLGHTDITLSKALQKDGVFKGSIAVLLESDYFDEALNPNSERETLGVTLINQAGDILNRFPSQNHVGQNLQGDNAFMKHIDSQQSTTKHLERSKVDGILKISVFHSIYGYPLIIATSDHYDAVIYRWTYSTFLNLLSFIALVSMILFLIRLAIKQQAFVQDTIDSVSSQIAVIDHEGFITAINSAWKRFSMENAQELGKMAPNTDVGSNYLYASGKTNDSELNSVYQGIRDVLEGRSKLFTYEYPCHSPYKERWFTMSVTPLRSDKKSAVIVHSDITERKLSEMKTRNLAFYDTLTKLPNRRLLGERMTMVLASSRRNKLYGALLLLDMDKFKQLNDTHGHAMGDMLLIEVAKRLNSVVREMDTVARLGGDEFVVVLSDLSQDFYTAKENAWSIAEKICLILHEPYALLEEEESNVSITYHSSASIGITLFCDEDIDQNELLKQADKAMYVAKERGGNQVQLVS